MIFAIVFTSIYIEMADFTIATHTYANHLFKRRKFEMSTKWRGRSSIKHCMLFSFVCSFLVVQVVKADVALVARLDLNAPDDTGSSHSLKALAERTGGLDRCADKLVILAAP